MTSVTILHDKAMEFSDRALLEKRRNNGAKFKSLTKKALDFELRAVECVRGDLGLEPTRSILFQSAASLAIDYQDFRLAEQLIAAALAGNPPDLVAEDLRDLLEQPYFKRHLQLRNVDLSVSQLQMTITGSEVGFGFALSDIFVDRISDIGRLFLRTVERMSGKIYRSGGPPPRSILDAYNLYMSAPRPGSFSVTLQVGRQLQIPGVDMSDQVIDEVMDCFSLFNEGKSRQLEEKIADESYLNNFIGLAKRIAPDGEKISMVGLTKVRNEKEISVALTRHQSDTQQNEILGNPDAPSVYIEVTGRLLFADARGKARRIEVIDENSKSHVIKVPDGMMDDIVKPLWDELVLVKGFKDGKSVRLHEIIKLDS